jgi:hypothetical protein
MPVSYPAQTGEQSAIPAFMRLASASCPFPTKTAHPIKPFRCTMRPQPWVTRKMQRKLACCSCNPRLWRPLKSAGKADRRPVT